MDPRKKVTVYTLAQAEAWANNHPFNHNPDAGLFKSELVQWMEGEGLFFGNEKDPEKVWQLYQGHILQMRRELIAQHKRQEAKKDPSINVLFRKFGLPARGTRKG